MHGEGGAGTLFDVGVSDDVAKGWRWSQRSLISEVYFHELSCGGHRCEGDGSYMS